MVFAVTVMFALPLKDIPLIVLAVARVVAVSALPVNGPLNLVADKVPVLGTKLSLLSEAFGGILIAVPVAVAHNGYTVDDVVVSFDIVFIFVAFVAFVT